MSSSAARMSPVGIACVTRRVLPARDAAALPQGLGQGALPAAAAADDPDPHWQRFRAVRMRSFTSMGAKEARMAQRFMASRSS
mgnify:CR=1 FL=1